MKRLSIGAVLVLGCSCILSAQDKPRVFVQGKGSENVTSSGSGGGGAHWGVWGSNSTVDSHDEAMEVTKDLQKNCGGVAVTLNQTNADYTVMLNRESKKNRGLLRTNSQVQVANKIGDVLGTNATHTVGNAAKDACQLIVADWQAHGRLQAPEASAAPAAQNSGAVSAVSLAPAATVKPAVATQPAQVVTVAAPLQQNQTVSSTSVAAGGSSTDGESLGDAGRKAKQHAACIELAKDNPSITCK